MKSLHQLRRQVRSRALGVGGSAGFTLIELMVVISIIAMLAAVAVGAIRQDQYAGQYSRFIEDVTGKLTQGRNWAVDRQTRVRLDFYADRVEMRSYNQITDAWDSFGQQQVSAVDGGVLDKGGVCIYGLVSGAQPPSDAKNVTPPASCIGGVQQLFFEPDGTFSVAGNVLSVPNTGATLYVADRSVPTQIKISLVQVFPGGLMRTFDHVY